MSDMKHLGVCLTGGRCRVNFQITKMPSKRDVLLLIQLLITEENDLMFKQCGSDLFNLVVTH